MDAVLDHNSAAEWDVIVIGSGSGGELAATECAGRGLSVLVVDSGRFGGECAYVACVPSKSMLVSAHAGLSWEEAIRRRETAVGGRDDRASRDSLTDAGVKTLRAQGRLLPPKNGHYRVRLDPASADPSTQDLSKTSVQAATSVVLATGSEPSIPPVEGIDVLEYWTSDQALSTFEQPASLIIMGGGAVGVELAQAYALLGTKVDLIEVDDVLLPSESRWVGMLIAEQLRADGVGVHVDASPQRVEASANGYRLYLRDGPSIGAEHLVVAGGRSPRSAGLGLEDLDVAFSGDRHIAIDRRCRVLSTAGSVIDGLYAVGDVTAESAYTHSANYQARIVADDLVGRGHDANYRAVPRVVFTQPSVFCVGDPPDRARERGLEVRTPFFDVSEVERAQLQALSTSHTEKRRVRAKLELVVDTNAGTLVGASCVGPEADSWAAELALAIRAEIPLELLAEHIRAFPTWSEAISVALEEAR